MKIRAPTVAEEVVEAGFDAVADLAALPAEEEDEDEVDAEGDQEEADQVEVALLEPGGQMQAAPFGFRFGLRFRAGFAFARRARASYARTCCPGSTPQRRHPCAAKFALNPARERQIRAG